jgi:outer membrane protein OmpA-like peptidoglycan-associated protein
MMQHKRLILLVTAIFLHIYVASAQKADTIHVYFNLNDAQLNPFTKNTIDSLVYAGAINDGKYMLIIGYADYLGSTEHNEVLSEIRAKNVQDYITAMGIDDDHIKSCLGKGEITRKEQTKDGHAPDRKVDIVIGKTNRIFNSVNKPIDTVAKTSGSIPPPSTKSPVKTIIAQTIDSLRVGETFILNNMYFYTGRHTLREESLPELNNLLKVLEDNPSLRIKIEGHVCCVPPGRDALDEDVNPIRRENDPPSPYYIRTLSLNRAKFIYFYLVNKGIEKDRLEFEGFGKLRPLIPVEKTVQDEEKNRRVEIRILEK